MPFITKEKTNWKYISVLFTLTIVAGVALFASSYFFPTSSKGMMVTKLRKEPVLEKEIVPETPLELLCVNTGGRIYKMKCCSSSSDFKNTCYPISWDAPCGYCLPEEMNNEVSLCDCGQNRCFVPPERGCVEYKENIVDQLVEDVKGNGVKQLIVLKEIMANNSKWGDYRTGGVLYIFTDESGETLEWKSDYFGLDIGDLISVVDNPAINAPVIRIEWGVGAHGSETLFIYWTGSEFKKMGEFFGDSGIYFDENGRVSVDSRHPDCMMSGTIRDIYEWDGNEYKLIETIDYGCDE